MSFLCDNPELVKKIEEQLVKTMLGQISGAATVVGGQQQHPYKIGSTYLIRTVTMFDTGVLVAVHEHELVLKDAAWIADTGRFSDALKKTEFNEVEPFPDGEVVIGRGSIIDAVVISKAPRERK